MMMREESFELEGLRVDFAHDRVRVGLPKIVTDGHYALVIDDLFAFLSGPYGHMDWELDVSFLDELHGLLEGALLQVRRTLQARGAGFSLVGARASLLQSGALDSLREAICREQ